MDLTKIKKELEEKQEEKIDIREVESSVTKKIDEQKVKDFASRIESFDISYQVDDKIKKATLQSKIMDAGARSKYEMVLSELASGMIFDNLPMETKNRYICLARLVCQVVKTPDWVIDKASEDLDFCYALGGKLVSHEARYFRYNGSEDNSNEVAPRFSIS